MREEHEQALETLKRGVEKVLSKNVFDNAAVAALDIEKRWVVRCDDEAVKLSPVPYLCVNYRYLCAEAKLLVATYNDKISNVDSDVNVLHYKEAIEMNKEWEKSLVCDLI